MLCSLNVTDLRSAMDYSAGMEPAAHVFLEENKKMAEQLSTESFGDHHFVVRKLTLSRQFLSLI